MHNSSVLFISSGSFGDTHGSFYSNSETSTSRLVSPNREVEIEAAGDDDKGAMDDGVAVELQLSRVFEQKNEEIFGCFPDVRCSLIVRQHNSRGG